MSHEILLLPNGRYASLFGMQTNPPARVADLT